MSAGKGRTWKAFKDVLKNFLGHNKSANYKSIVEKLMSAMKDLGGNISIKVHYMHSHLDWFPENLGDVSEEQGERRMEERDGGTLPRQMGVQYNG